MSDRSHSDGEDVEAGVMVPMKEFASSDKDDYTDNQDAKKHRETVRSQFLQQSSMLLDLREKKLRELFPPPKQPILLDFKNVNFKANTKVGSLGRRKNVTRHILKNVSGSVAPGEFLVILGPSGAGKTTLLNILAGRLKSGVTGDILINGEPRNKTCHKKHSAFVLQEDLFFSELTVTETLHLTARLVLPNTMSVKDKIQRAEDMIDLFKIRKCANTITGSPLRRGLSGGEKKRLNIANELLGNSTMVVMDEPTSGLDASTALQVVSMLKQLAQSGKTVIATLHQPSSQMFEMFDKLLILADGRVAFHGTPADSLTHFANLGFECPQRFNPADHLLSLVDETPDDRDQKTTNYRDIILDAYEKGNYGSGGINPKPVQTPESLGKKRKGQAYPCGFLEQFYLLSKRGFKQHILEAVPTFFIFMIIAILSSIVWWRRGHKEQDIYDRVGLLFFIAVHWFVMPMFSAMGVMINERVIIRKERPAGMYRLSAYFLSRSISHIPIDMITPVVFTCIVYWCTNLNSDVSRFFIFLGISFLAHLAGQALGLIFGCYFDRQEKASPMVMVFFFISTLVGGFYIAIHQIQSWFRWTQYISVIKYIMDALRLNEFKGDDVRFKLANPTKNHKYMTGEEFLESADLIWDDIWPYALVLVGVYFCGMFLAYWILRWQSVPRK